MRCIIMGRPASLETSPLRLGDKVEDDEEDNEPSNASMRLKLFNDHFSENTSFRYLAFAEWKTGKVIPDAYAVVERPHWLLEFYGKCARHGEPPVIQNPPFIIRRPMYIFDNRFARRKREKILYVTFADCRCLIPVSSVAPEAEPGLILRARISTTVGLVTFLVNALKRRGIEVSSTVRGFAFGFVGAL